MRAIKTLRRSNEGILNSLLKSKKTESFVILYHSEWCDYSNAILEKAYAWAQEEGEEELYIVSSWELPHAFAAFAVTNAPTLVEVSNGKVTVHVEYPKIYEYFVPSKDRDSASNQRHRPKRKYSTPR